MGARRHRRRTVRVQVAYEAGGGVHQGLATTLGAGGLFLQTDQGLARGTELVARFRLRDGGAIHEIDARVVWGQAPGSPAAGCGLEFTDPVAAARLAHELESD